MSSEWLSACESSCSDYPVGIDDLCGTGVKPRRSSLHACLEPLLTLPAHQVIVGFIGGAFIAIVFLTLYYLWAYDAATCDAAPVNPVDEWVLRGMRGWARRKLPRLAARLARNQHSLTEAIGEASSAIVSS